MRFAPNNEKDKKQMLEAAGIKSISELFADVPKEMLLEKPLQLPKELNERELKKEIESIAAKNKSAKQLSLFLGAGCYNHFIPATVPAILSRSEFYTAYTPYQPEISQGMLQAQYEWQTYICLLTGMDLANASMYDGASATAEAMLMARNATGRKKALVEKGLNPEYRAVLQTYANATGMQLKQIDATNLAKEIDEQTACFIVQQPDFFGRILSLQEMEKAVHEKQALFVVSVSEAMSLAFKKLSDANPDIAAIDVQSLGNRMSFGGPGAGVIACKQNLMRHIPGRLVGKTSDKEGNEGFVLTLQAREQHIRRDKASSNICSNHALGALATTVYLATVGQKGLKQIAEENHRNALYLANKVEEAGFELPFGKGFFNEFVVKKEGIEEVQQKLLEKGIVFGYALGKLFPELSNCVLLAATEMNSKQEIEILGEELKGLK